MRGRRRNSSKSPAYNAEVLVTKLGQNGEEDSPAVSGSSILGLMMLGADAGSKLRIDSEGGQAQEVVSALLKEPVEQVWRRGVTPHLLRVPV